MQVARNQMVTKWLQKITVLFLLLFYRKTANSSCPQGCRKRLVHWIFRRFVHNYNPLHFWKDLVEKFFRAKNRFLPVLSSKIRPGWPHRRSALHLFSGGYAQVAARPPVPFLYIVYTFGILPRFALLYFLIYKYKRKRFCFIMAFSLPVDLVK